MLSLLVATADKTVGCELKIIATIEPAGLMLIRPAKPKVDMNKAIGLALLVIGAVLVIFGINASDSFGSDVSRFFTGAPTDKSVWLLLSGIAAVIVGSAMCFRRGTT